MVARTPQKGRRTSPFQIILPSFLSIVLFTAAIFWIILPFMEEHLMERKRDMIRMLTQTAWSTLSQCHEEQRSGKLTETEAQAKAIDLIRNVRYGQEMKDYFWINDMHPRMVMHPYRSDLDGQDLTTFSDPNGKKLFVSFVEAVKNDGHGYVDYMWQWKDDTSRIVPKLSYVKHFKPWNWIIGTGLYLEDVKIEIEAMIRKITMVSLAILGIIALLSFYIMWRGLQIDAVRKKAEKEWKASEERLKRILNAVPAGVLVIDAENNTIVDANPVAVQMIGATKEKVLGRTCSRFSGMAEKMAQHHMMEGASPKSERTLVTGKGKRVPVLTTVVPVELAGRKHLLNCFFDISDLKKAETALKKSEEKFRNLFNNAQVGLFRTGIDDGTIQECNDRFAQMFGFESGKEIVGRSMTDFYVEQRDRLSMINHLKNHSILKNYDVRFKNKNGVVLWVRFSARFYSGGRFMEGVAIDITEQKRAEAQLKQHVEALSMARETARAAQKSAEAERDKSDQALKEISEAKHSLEVLLSDSTAREKRMVELKDEVNVLLRQLDETPKYTAPEQVEELMSTSLLSGS